MFLVWNRRLHYYIGLYLLFFCWLFAFTGLLLNHSKWEFAQFWPNRVQSSTLHEFRAPSGSTDLARARDLMQQLDIAGEIQWPARQPMDGPFTFQVSRPGHVIEVKADLTLRRATLQRNELNAWGVMHLLHTFTGVPSTNPLNDRDWPLTTVWALTMDAVAVGLMLMVFSSYVMWFQLKLKRRSGTVASLLGFGSCGAFVAGLRWLI
ncbi:MAG: hypothetical protein ACRD15_02750 [Vicinamibacterales bacterium]